MMIKSVVVNLMMMMGLLSAVPNQYYNSGSGSAAGGSTLEMTSTPTPTPTSSASYQGYYQPTSSSSYSSSS